MKKLYSLSFLYIALSCLSYADPVPYGQVLFRVNAGGVQETSIDTSAVNWITDNYLKPCIYVDTLIMGNKVYTTMDSVAFHPSVPTSTPYKIFKTERDLGKWELSQLEYNFPVAAGTKVEVRLFFAEIYYDNSGARVFDIMLEQQLMEAGVDIYAQVGKNVGMMKAFTVTSDGNLDIDLKRITQLPIVSAIEIIEIKDVTVAGIFSSKKTEPAITAFPNPCTTDVSLDWGKLNAKEVRLFNSFGQEVTIIYSGNTISLENCPKGIYFLQATTDTYQTETIRLIKQ